MGRISLRWTVPAMIAATLVAAVSVFGVVAYRAVKASTLTAAMERLRNAATQFALPAQAGPPAWERDAEAVASDPAVRALLRESSRPSTAAAGAVIERLRPDSSPMLAIDVRDPRGNVLLTLGASLSAAERIGPAAYGDSAVTTPLYERAGRILYERAVPIREGQRVAGHLVEIRTVVASVTALSRLSDIIGNKAVLVLGNADGSLWTDLTGRIEHPAPSPVPKRYERNGRRWIGATTHLAQVPWIIGVEFPEDVVLAPVRALFWRFLLFAGIVIALGTFAGARMSRSLTTPLLNLTAAAEAIASGDRTDHALDMRRADEIGRLSRAFSAMADSIRQSRENLEHQIHERTVELQAALEHLREAQNELVRKERLATLGQLSSSIGHELRNPLGVMTNALYFLEVVLAEASPKVKGHLGILQSQVRLAGTIVSDILDYARIRPAQRMAVPVGELVEEQLARASFPETIYVERRLPADFPPVSADPTQVGQILFNLFRNAAQAMDGRGLVGIAAQEQNGRARIDVSDSGPGIPAEHVEKIFEPLFTTKARGTGLGLAVARSLARANDGDVFVSNRPGGGAVFTLELPLAERVADAEPGGDGDTATDERSVAVADS